MTTGTQTNRASVDASLTQLALNLRDGANSILQQQAYLNKLGLTGLQGLGYTAGDAQAVLDDVNHMATVAQVYKGTATQGSLFSFEDSLVHLWSGQ